MTNFKVLVVDDDSDLTFLIRQRLESKGFEVRTANAAEDGYAAFLSFRPDLVITDIELGGEINGLHLIDNVRSFAPNMRAIYITGDLSRYRAALEKERKKFRADFMEKPFAGSDLMRLVCAQEQG